MGARPMPSPEVAIRELQRISDAALASLSMQELLNELLERIVAILTTDTAAILLLDEVAGDLVAQAAKGIEEEVERGVRIPVGRGFAGRIAAQQKAVAIEDVDHADILNPILREKGIRSLLGVPLLVEGRVIGVLHVGTLVPSALLRPGARPAPVRRRPCRDRDRARAAARPAPCRGDPAARDAAGGPAGDPGPRADRGLPARRRSTPASAATGTTSSSSSAARSRS